MPVPNGPRGNPRFDLDDDADFPTDLTAVSDWAAMVADRTEANKTAADAIAVKWDGMTVYTLAEKTLWLWDGGSYKILFMDWVSFTPNWVSGLTPGGSPQNAKWRQWGTTVEVYMNIRMVGATIGSDWRFDLPAPMADTFIPTTDSNPILGSAGFKDVSSIVWYGGAVRGIKAGNRGIVLRTQGTDGQQAPMSGAAPFIWDTSDVLDIHLLYPTA